jgi:O-antigen/teichoic acid export membrane protein
VSVGKRAACGALWSVASSVGARIVGLIGTLYMTRLLDPDVVGEVAAAMVLAQTANWLSNWGFNQYMIVRGPESAAASYLAALTNWSFAVIGLTIDAFLGPAFEPVFDAPRLSATCRGWCCRCSSAASARCPTRSSPANALHKRPSPPAGSDVHLTALTLAAATRWAATRS